MFVLNATHKVTGKKKNRNNEVVKPTLLAVLHGSKFYYSSRLSLALRLIY